MSEVLAVGSHKNQNLVQGIGVNDSPTPVYTTVTGKQVTDHCYQAWQHMLERCYDPKFHERCPTYIGCTVVEEWRSFTVFRSWMLDQDYHGKHLDKDIIHPGNKMYSPEFCCFVSRQVNNLLTDHGAARGEWPKGVYFDKRNGRFIAHIRKHSKLHNLGYFDTPQEAAAVYRASKSAHITEIANQHPDSRIRAGLLLHAANMRKSNTDETDHRPGGRATYKPVS